MNRLITTVLLLTSLSFFVKGQKEDAKFSIKLNGFVKTDIFYDSRQTVNVREGHFLLYPDNIVLDDNKNDINNTPSFNMLSIQSRLQGKITGPDAFGAKTSGVLEADFFGNAGSGLDDVNGFRLRHAFVKLNWISTELLVGQYWHPLFVSEAFPGTVSFNTGAPFQPFSRNPQIRFTKKTGNISLTAIAYTQRDFTSIGNEYTYSTLTSKYTSGAVASSKYIRNAAIPNANFQIQFKPDSSEHAFSIGADYKSILPEMYTINNSATQRYTSKTKLNSISAFVSSKLKFKPLTVKLQATYAENAYDMSMIGGYAVKQIIDTATGKKEFSNLNTSSLWIDINTNGKKIQYGLFGGYSQNLGSNDKISTSSFFARGANIEYLYRVSPRITFISGKLNIAAECEYTFVMYGKTNGNGKGVATNGVAVDNIRGLLSFIYIF